MKFYESFIKGRPRDWNSNSHLLGDLDLDPGFWSFGV